jgi:AcrR family transcriptional regulator
MSELKFEAEQQRMDRRVLRTKQQIRQALIDLLCEKSEKDISVRELAQRAGINRGTFYIHYKDIHDLVEQLVDEATETLRAVCKRHPPAQTPRESYPFLTDLFETLQRDPQLFCILLGSSGSHAYSERICVMLQENFLDDLLAVFYSADPKQRQVASGFIVAGCLHQALRWLENGTQESPDEIAYLTGRVIMHGIDALR